MILRPHKTKMTKVKFFILIVSIAIFCVFVGWVDTSTDERNQQEIIGFCSANSYRVISIERCYFDSGPFYYCGKGNMIYKVITDKHIMWVRKGYWTNDIEITN